MWSDLIERLGRARLAGEPLGDAGQLLSSVDAEDGYEIQTGLAAWFTSNGAGPVAGYKIGATTKVMQDLLGVPGPVYGHIMSRSILTSSFVFACNPECQPGVECEIAFRLGEALAPSSTPYGREDVAACIDAVMPAIEIVENRYGDYRRCSTALLTADDFFHKACVLADATSDWREVDLAASTGRLSVNAKERETGQGEDVLGHPLEAVVWLANKLAAHGQGLAAGQIIMTGSMTPVHWIEAFPARVEIEIDGLGASAVELIRRA